MNLLRWKDTVDEMTRSSGVQWYGRALRRDNDNLLRRASDFEVVGRRATKDNVEKASGRTY